MAKPLQVFIHRPLVMRDEAQSAQAEFSSRDYFCFELPFAKKNALSDVHLSPRPDQRFPGVTIHSARQKDLNLPGQVLRSRGPRRLLRAHPRAPPKEPRWNHSRIVEN